MTLTNPLEIVAFIISVLCFIWAIWAVVVYWFQHH